MEGVVALRPRRASTMRGWAAGGEYTGEVAFSVPGADCGAVCPLATQLCAAVGEQDANERGVDTRY